MALHSIFRIASSSSYLVPVLNFRRCCCCCDSASSEQLTARDIYHAKYVPPGLPFKVRDYGTHDGLFLERRYRNNLVLGQVTYFMNPAFKMEFTVIEKDFLVCEAGTAPDRTLRICMLIVRSAMFAGRNPSPDQSKEDYLEGFDNFFETKGINSSTLKFLFDRFRRGLRPPERRMKKN